MNARRATRLEVLDRWIFASYAVEARGLGLFRIAYALYTLGVLAPGYDRYVDFTMPAAFPDAFFVPPPGPMSLFPGFPPASALAALEVLLNLSLVAVLFGYRTRAASVLTFVLFLLGYGFTYSFGKVNHTFLFILLPLVMAGSGWGGAYSYDARHRAGPAAAAAWPLSLLALLLGFAMFTAGFAKLLGGWLDPSTHAVYGHVAKQFFVRGRSDLLAPFLLRLRSGFLWEAADYATVALELGFLAAAFRARWTRAFAGLAVLFHFGVVLSLNIAFTFNLIVYAAFIDWRRVDGWLRRRGWTRAFAWLLGGRGRWWGAMAGASAWFVFAGSPLLWMDGLVPFSSDLVLREVLVLAAACVLVVWLGARSAVRRARAGLRRTVRA